MSLPPHHRLYISGKFHIEHFENEVLLYSPTETTAVYLNETAFLVYKLCNDGQSIEQLVALLESAYPESSPTIRQDVLATVEELVEKGILLVGANG